MRSNGNLITIYNKRPIENPSGRILPAVPDSFILLQTLKKRITGIAKSTITGMTARIQFAIAVLNGAGYDDVTKMITGIYTISGIEADVRYPAARIEKTAKMTSARDDAKRSM